MNPSDRLFELAFLAKFSTVPMGARKEYVEQEMQRVVDAGVHPLHAVHYCVFDDQRDAAIGWCVNFVRVVQLKLVDGAKPPTCDAHGRALPEAKQGKVLVCKVGTIGGAADCQGEEATRWSGPGRNTTLRQRGSIYRQVEITSAPSTLTITDALTVLNQWGKGMTPSEFIGRDPATRKSRWLVEVVTTDAATPAPPAPQSNQRSERRV